MTQIGQAGIYGEREFRPSSWNGFPTRVKSFELYEQDGYRPIRPVSYMNWRGENHEGKFHRQNNDYDCGPCMIANLASILNKNIPQLASVNSVRTAIDTLHGSITDQRRPLGLFGDIGPVLEQLGFDIYTALDPNLFQKSKLHWKVDYDYVINNFYRGNIGALICFEPSREHFKAFVPNSEDSYICLDSLKPAPELVQKKDVREIVAECVSGGPFGEFYVLI